MRELVDGGRARRRATSSCCCARRRRRRPLRARAAGVGPRRRARHRPRLLRPPAGARPVRLPAPAAQPLRRPRAARGARLAARRRLQRRAVALRAGGAARPLFTAVERTLPAEACPSATRGSLRPSGSSTTGSCARSARLGLAALLERDRREHDYDLACLAAPDGERRFANVRKLVRLARDYEALRGPDLAGLRRRRRGCDAAADVARPTRRSPRRTATPSADDDPRRQGPRVPRGRGRRRGRGAPGVDEDLVALPDGRVRLQGARRRRASCATSRLRGRLQRRARRADRPSSGRVLYVALTRAVDRLIVSGAVATGAHGQPSPLGWMLDGARVGASATATGEVAGAGRAGSPCASRAIAELEPAEAAPRPEAPGRAAPSSSRCSRRSTRSRRCRRRAAPGRAAAARRRCRRRRRTCRAASRSPRCPARALRATATTPSACSGCAARPAAGARGAAGSSGAELGTRSTACSRRAAAPSARTPPRRACRMRARRTGERVAELLAALGAPRSWRGSLAALDAGSELPFCSVEDDVVFGLLDPASRVDGGTALVVDYKTNRLGDARRWSSATRTTACSRRSTRWRCCAGRRAVEVHFAFLDAARPWSARVYGAATARRCAARRGGRGARGARRLALRARGPATPAPTAARSTASAPARAVDASSMRA